MGFSMAMLGRATTKAPHGEIGAKLGLINCPRVYIRYACSAFLNVSTCKLQGSLLKGAFQAFMALFEYNDTTFSKFFNEIIL